MNKDVKEYIQKQASPKKEIIERLREIILETLKDCDEKMMWGTLAFRGGKFYIAAMKERVHIGFSINGLTPEEIKEFEGNGKTMRHIKISSLTDIDKKKLVKLIKLVDKKAICKPC